jgi:sensor histidine kinase YesM
MKNVVYNYSPCGYISNLFHNFYGVNEKRPNVENREMKHTDDTTKRITDSIKINDIGFRLILIPFFGIVTPVVTGLIDQSTYSLWQTKLSYLYTIGISFIIWQGNRFLLFTLRTYFNWFNRPVRKIVALVLAISFYTIPVSVLLIVGWFHIFAEGRVDWNIVSLNALIIMIAVLFIVHVYETVFLVKEAETEKVQRAQTERAKAEAELEALKNQIDPHFIFNSLNTLSHLIEENPIKAKQFNDDLADVYRYILTNKARDLVLLREEMDFLKGYFSLLKIRFEEAIQLDITVPESQLDQFLVPPISLQILVENAIKHNEFSVNEPLMIVIILQEEIIIVHNNLRKKQLRKSSSGIGLKNLNERYNLTTNNFITITEGDKFFTVRLPVLKIA